MMTCSVLKQSYAFITIRTWSAHTTTLQLLHGINYHHLLDYRTCLVINRLVTSLNKQDASTSSIFEQVKEQQTLEYTKIPFLQHSSNAQKQEKTWLVVGDGDLSYSASLSRSLNNDDEVNSSSEQKIQLLASVLEDQVTHHNVYRDSKCNMKIINNSTSSNVIFGLDATKLEEYFPKHSIQRIIFNFPHWIGKNNNRYNRKLINEFLHSASKVLDISDGSEIHIALCQGQGGIDDNVNTIHEWKNSWLVPMYANIHGLLLHRIEPFIIEQYNLSSHRGKDKPFFVGKQPYNYIFKWPNNNNTIDPTLQISFRHELRLILDKQQYWDQSNTELLLQSVQNILQDITPNGIRSEIPIWDLITSTKNQQLLLVCLIVYSGENYPITRSYADTIREQLEISVMEHTGYDIAKKNRMVSKPFPYKLLNTLIEDRS